MQARATLEQIFPQPPDSQARIQMRMAEAGGQRVQGFRNFLPVGGAWFLGALPKAGVKVKPHSLPVKGLVWPDFLARRTSVFTAWQARSACFSLAPYSCRT